ncbi:methyltransferase domain-containing protein [Leucobacter tenebrionis]|uniref:methyltransferase domain-containing protein n=1 Tax=Leucobacter tenebrionis TaxID=2873270 RepID=UPI001CA64F5F|nr:methyltransferase domain-containing protein [Leucobacter tenebrionis]
MSGAVPLPSAGVGAPGGAADRGDRASLPLVTDGNPICGYFEAGRCRSCTLIETPYAQQLREKEERCRELLPDVPERAWLPSVPGGVRDFRNKAKLVVGGRPGKVTLGILGPDGSGVDLRDCLIQEPVIRAAIPHLARFLDQTGLPPYDVPKRRGELKFVHVTASPDGDLMLRFVVRSERSLEVLRGRLEQLRRAVPSAVVVSVNLLPEHKAVLEGEREELLLGSSLSMGTGSSLALHLRPRSFFQTNTSVARALYAQAAAWVDRADPASLWDLYCGVGGFALHCAGRAEDTAALPARRVLGVEISEEAVRSARRSAREAGIAARFEAADATAFALAARREDRPEAVIVNPPRRGIGAELAAWLEGGAGIRHVVYSSCNPESLARDLAAMPSFSVREARVFDMFPHTRHMEVAVLLER